MSSTAYEQNAVRAGHPGQDPTPDPAASPALSSLLGDLGSLTREYRATARSWLELVALETRLAARSVVHLIALAVGMTVLLLGAWMTLIGAAVLALMDLGLSPALAMLAATAINLVAAAVVYLRLRSKGRSIGWPATSRALKDEVTAPAGSRES